MDTSILQLRVVKLLLIKHGPADNQHNVIGTNILWKPERVDESEDLRRSRVFLRQVPEGARTKETLAGVGPERRRLAANEFLPLLQTL